MSHLAASHTSAHTSAHRSPGSASARPQATAGQPQGGSAPAGLFALLLRGQQGDSDPAPEATPEPEAAAQDTPPDEHADRPESTTSPAGAPTPTAVPAPAAAADWTPTVRSAAVSEPPAEAGGDALLRLGHAARHRAAAAKDLAQRSGAPDGLPETAVTERPDIQARDPARTMPTDTPAQALVVQAGPEPQPQTNPAHPSAGTLPSLGSASDTTAAAPAPGEPAPIARAHLPQPPTSPAFAPALGLQISTWLREGVQHAALELNPAELGPIDVRIALRDGQAQVALAAEVPFTRQALAEALPQLAEALGEVGVQLAGGDVSDQAGRRARDEPSARPHAGNSGLPAGGEATSTPVPVGSHRRGLLDLYA